MTANELRIGNYLYSTKFDENIKIDEYHILNFSDKEVDTFKPIPLTFEMIVKCGFIKLDNGNYVKQVAHLTYLEYRYTKPITAPSRILSECYEWVISHEISDIPYDIWLQPNYIHQLQNLYYCLAGEELEVNLIDTSNPY